MRMTGRGDYTIRTYGDQIAGVYDQYYPSCDPAVIETLKRLAGTGDALELGIGTGRVALPLRAAGVRVSGIDASEAMVARLRARPGGDGVPVTIADFTDVGVEGRFGLVYVVFNTFFNLLSQDAQIRCFKNVAARLAPEGVFVLETFVPDLCRFHGGQDVRVISQSDDQVRLDVSQIDPVAQIVTATHVALTAAGPRFFPVKLRYAWPAEMDLMARLAGMGLRERWGGWDQRPFTQASASHISVYGLDDRRD